MSYHASGATAEQNAAELKRQREEATAKGATTKSETVKLPAKKVADAKARAQGYKNADELVVVQTQAAEQATASRNKMLMISGGLLGGGLLLYLVMRKK